MDVGDLPQIMAVWNWRLNGTWHYLGQTEDGVMAELLGWVPVEYWHFLN